MLRSMTAFGRAEIAEDGRTYTCEIRSLNSRFLEVSIRLPRRYGVIEEQVKKQVAAHLSRGRVELAVQVNGDRGENAPVRCEINLAVARSYHEQLERLRLELGIAQPVGLEVLLGVGRDIFETKEEEENIEVVGERIGRLVEAALRALDAMRLEEGRALGADFAERLLLLEGLLSGIAERCPAVVEDYRRRLAERVRSALAEAGMDEARLLTEVTIFTDRTDVSEEQVRARSHMEQFRSLLRGPEPVGRKLNFLLQEMNREVNTIGSKSADVGISRLVIEAKSELERMREQVQNVE
ncbi:MAG: YicC/YloC family endoribonuclease [Pseudomonadota bacterium]